MLQYFVVSPHPGTSAFMCRQAQQFHEDAHRVLYAMARHNNDLRAIYKKLYGAVESLTCAYDLMRRGMQAAAWVHVRELSALQTVKEHYDRYRPSLVDLVIDNHEPLFRDIWQQQVLLDDPQQVQVMIERLEHQNQMFCSSIMAQQDFIVDSMNVLSREYTASTLQWLLTEAGATAATISSAQIMMNEYWQHVQALCLRTGLGFAATELTELTQQQAAAVDQAAVAPVSSTTTTATTAPVQVLLWEQRQQPAQQQLVVRSTRAVTLVTPVIAPAGCTSRPDATSLINPVNAASTETAGVEAADKPSKAVSLLLRLPPSSRAAEVFPAADASISVNNTATSCSAAVEELAADEEDLPSEDAAAADQYDAVVTLALPAISSRAHKVHVVDDDDDDDAVEAGAAGCLSANDANHSLSECCATASSSSSSSTGRIPSVKSRAGKLLRGVVRAVQGVVVAVAVTAVVKGIVRAGTNGRRS